MFKANLLNCEIIIQNNLFLNVKNYFDKTPIYIIEKSFINRVPANILSEVHFEYVKEKNNFRTFKRLLEFLLNNNVSKDSLLVLIGSEELISLGGFVAHMYCGGCNYIYVPTTLYSMVDLINDFHPEVLIGDKGINLSVNSMPTKILIDPYILDYSNINDIGKGMELVIRLAYIYDEILLDQLHGKLSDGDIIRKVIVIKCNLHSVSDFGYKSYASDLGELIYEMFYDVYDKYQCYAIALSFTANSDDLDYVLAKYGLHTRVVIGEKERAKLVQLLTNFESEK